MHALAAFGNSTYLLKLARRALFVWAFARPVLTLLNTGITGFSATLPPVVILLLAAVIGTLLQIDSGVMRENIFYANLGTPRRAAFVMGALMVVALELFVTVLAGIVA